jgi:hypothetical protein
MKRSAAAAPVAAVILAVALGACGSHSSGLPPQPSVLPTPHASASATGTTAAMPAGDRSFGGSGQGISVDIPSSWTEISTAQASAAEAIKRISTQGVNATTMTQSVQLMQKLKGVIAVDVASAADSPGHFATSINAYCAPSGISHSGSAGVAGLRQEAPELAQALNAYDIKTSDEEVGGIPGLLVTYDVNATGGIVVHNAQLQVLPKALNACFVTLSASGQLPSAVLTTAAATAQYP